MGDSIGDGGGRGDQNPNFVNTGYGTHDGSGNVRTGAEDQEGTGYDQKGQVKTAFGTWGVTVDPVTGAATLPAGAETHFEGYEFPASRPAAPPRAPPAEEESAAPQQGAAAAAQHEST